MPRLGSWLLAKLMARCDAVTAVSDDILGWLSHQVPRRVRKLKISPGTTLLPGDYRESRRALAVSETSYVATFVGPLFWSEKVAGVKLLARSFGEFARRVPESKLFVVGGGPRLGEVEDFVANLDVGANVVIVGETRDPARYLNACDVYAHVSYMEGLPLSLLDAMSAGKAVIASKVGDIPEVVRTGESGILVENREDEIVAALSTLSADPALRDRLGKTGQRLVLGAYTWGAAARKFLTVYGGA
jgi:glycosyltransferase involved in cell wall biosynthesis